MRLLGWALLSLGVLVGSMVGLAMLGGPHLTGLSWLVAVGLAKLTLLTSGGLMAGGAVCLRLDRRAAERAALRAGSDRHLED